MAKSYFYDENISDWRELVKGEQGEQGPVGPAVEVKRVAPGQDIQESINEATAQGGGIVHLDRGTHTLTRQLTLSSDIVLEGEPGTVLDISGMPEDVAAISGAGTYSRLAGLSSAAVAGNSTLQLSSGSEVSAGDWLKISSAEVFGLTDQPRGEIVRVSSVSGSTLTLEDPLDDDYPAVTTTHIEKLDPISGITIRDLKVVGSPVADKSVIGVDLTLAFGLSMSNVQFYYCNTAAVYISDTVGANFQGCYFQDSLRPGFAYGIAILFASQDITVTGCVGVKLRHLITIGGGSGFRGVTRRVTVTSCIASQCTDAGFDLHPGGEYVTFNACHVKGSEADGIVLQGGTFVVSNCTVDGAGRHGIMVQNLSIRGVDGVISGNVVRGAIGRGILISIGSNESYRTWSGLVISGNSIRDSGHGIEITNTSDDFFVNGVSVTGNVITRAAIGRGLGIRGCGGSVVQGNTVLSPGPNFDGIYLFNCPETNINGNHIDGDGIAARGIYAYDVPLSTFTSNQIRNADNGLFIRGESPSVVCVGNISSGTILVPTEGNEIAHNISTLG